MRRMNEKNSKQVYWNIQAIAPTFNYVAKQTSIMYNFYSWELRDKSRHSKNL